MSTECSPKPGEIDDPFAYLYPYEFVLLTERTSGKIKRIRNNGRVLLAPCDVMGNMRGPQVEAYARELPAAQHGHADALLAQKYGTAYEMDSPREADEENEETYMEIVSRDHVLRDGAP
jgi:PPOX class probable F420-dependent enzyme